MVTRRPDSVSKTPAANGPPVPNSIFKRENLITASIRP